MRWNSSETWAKEAAQKLARELEDARLTHALERRAAGQALGEALDKLAIPHGVLKAGTIVDGGYIFQVRRTVGVHRYELRMGISLVAFHRKHKEIPPVAWSVPINDQAEMALAIIAVEKHFIYWKSVAEKPLAQRLWDFLMTPPENARAWEG
jgi:hypothetical protein